MKRTSAVKRLKYLIAINRIYVIVNSKLIAINRNSKCPFVYVFLPSFYFYLNALINMEKCIGLLYANVLFYLKPTMPNRAVQNEIIKYTFEVNKDSAYSEVKPWLNIFFFFKFAGNIAVRPLISETMNYFFAFSQLPVDIFRQHFCTTQLLKVNFPFRSFLSSISRYRAHHSLQP